MTQQFTDIEQQPADRFSIAIRYGLLTGFVSIFIYTISYLYLLKSGYGIFLLANILSFFVTVAFYIIAATKQRKINGGFIEIKDAFQVIFVVILISVIMKLVYEVIYVKYIDPGSVQRTKDAFITFVERFTKGEGSEDMRVKMEEAGKGGLSVKSFIFQLCSSLIGNSIIGLLVALIVKRTRTTVIQ
jgi:hypothetical protein